MVIYNMTKLITKSEQRKIKKQKVMLGKIQNFLKYPLLPKKLTAKVVLSTAGDSKTVCSIHLRQKRINKKSGTHIVLHGEIFSHVYQFMDNENYWLTAIITETKPKTRLKPESVQTIIQFEYRYGLV